MLRSFLLTALFVLMGTVAHAENQSSTFTMFYGLNKIFFFQKNTQNIEKGCIKAGNIEKSECAAEAEKTAYQMLAYAAYRMTTEKSMQDSITFRDCWKGTKPESECADTKAYTAKVYNDYMDVVNFQNEIGKLPKEKTGN